MPGAGVVAAACALVLAAPADAIWRESSEGLPPNDGVLTLAVEDAAKGSTYAGLIRYGIYRDAGGRTWRSVTNFPRLAGEAIMSFAVSILSLATDPSRPGTVYAGTSFSGLLVSRDGGRSWFPSNHGLEGRAAGDRAYLFSVDALAVSPSQPAIVYAAIRSRGVYRSTFRGVQWDSTAPLPALDVRALAVHPKRPDVVYAGTLGGGIYKSVDGGASWRTASRGLGSRFVYRIVLNPLRPRIAYAATQDGVFKSLDGGRRWARAGTGLDGMAVRDLAVHPRAPGTLYAAVKGSGIFRSEDGGARWWPFSAGLANRLVMALALGPRSGVLHAATLGGVYARPVGGR